ncbi:MAG: Gfo/Idh/MocA family oxidoreductase, partial [Planctomycetota bacterium]|nr:Gfo/Idh/MocA family oxidoreductase [Planctomycetota bacterium]
MFESSDPATRRAFLKTSAMAAAAVGAPMVMTGTARGQQADWLRLGLVGCGGRGAGAVVDAIKSSPKVKVVALADLATERLHSARKNLQKAWAEKGNYAVSDDACFVGVDAYQQLCAHPDVDIMIHATPPGLRHLTLRAAVENGKHSFVEKPVCVDPFTYRHVVESGKLADQQGLAIVSGTQYRRENSYRQAIKRLQDGIIGELQGGFSYYCAGLLWLRGQEADWQRWGGFDGMEYQMRNWLYSCWLSGDHVCEQAVHSIDAVNWGFGGPPV